MEALVGSWWVERRCFLRCHFMWVRKNKRYVISTMPKYVVVATKYCQRISK